MLSVTEVSKILGVSRQMVHKLVQEDKITYYRIGNLYRFDEKDVEKYVELCRGNKKPFND